MDGRMDKNNAYCPGPYVGGGIIIVLIQLSMQHMSAITLCTSQVAELLEISTLREKRHSHE